MSMTGFGAVGGRDVIGILTGLGLMVSELAVEVYLYVEPKDRRAVVGLDKKRCHL